MERVKYEKPELKFEEVMTDEAIANTCWGYHGTETDLFYDTEGKGWVSFQIAAGSCTLSLTNVYYYENKTDKGTKIEEGDSRYTETYNAVLGSGGNTGNPYKGEGSVVFPENPEPEWS